MDLYGFNDKDNRTIIDIAIPRDQINQSAKLVVEKLREVQAQEGKIDVIVGPSGYGMQLKPAQCASDQEIAEATFMTEADVKRRLRIVGLRELMLLLRDADDLNTFFTQGVIHLTTVPKYRKANKIDMGTSDKVLSVVLAVKDQSERLNIPYNQTSFILVEVGFGYTSTMAVKDGQIVDAMAGTAGFPSFLGSGFFDSEVAYAIANTTHDFSKQMLFAGGAASYAKFDISKPIEEFIQNTENNLQFKEGLEMMLESAVKDVASLLPSTMPREIIISGRFVRIPLFLSALNRKFANFFRNIKVKMDINILETDAQITKQAAEGAAIFANGLARGKYQPLIDTMKLRLSEGSVFSNLYFGNQIAEGLQKFQKI